MKKIATILRTLSEMKEAAESGEINPSAYGKAFSAIADASTDHSDWCDPVINIWKDALSSIGMPDADIRYTGFDCKDDGVSFTSRFIREDDLIDFLVAPPKPSTSIAVGENGKELFQPWIVHKIGGIEASSSLSPLLRIAKEGNMGVWLVRKSNSHQVETYVELMNTESDILEELKDAAEIGCEINWMNLQNKLNYVVEHLRMKLCHAIYRDLRDEYEYLRSEESVMENAIANEYHFDENGNLHR